MVSTYLRSHTHGRRTKVDSGKDRESAENQKAVSMVCFSSILVVDIVAEWSMYHNDLCCRSSSWLVRGLRGTGGQVVHEDWIGHTIPGRNSRRWISGTVAACLLRVSTDKSRTSQPSGQKERNVSKSWVFSCHPWVLEAPRDRHVCPHMHQLSSMYLPFASHHSQGRRSVSPSGM